MLALVLAVLPLVFPNNYFFEIAILVALNAIVCVGLNLLIGYAGQISLGHAGFYALGAYGSAILAARWGWPAWLARCRWRWPRSALLAWAVGPADAAPEGPLPGDGHARPGRHRLHRARRTRTG